MQETIQNQKRTKAKKIKQLFKTYKKTIGRYKSTADFKEPVMLLMTRKQKIQFYENATQGLFEFEHSDGSNQMIMLDTNKIQTFEYGDKTFKGYICHEDHGTPIPQDPLLSTEMLSILIEKTLSDIKKWKTAEIKAKFEGWHMVLMGIAAIGIVIVLYVMLKPQSTPQAIQTATTIAETTVRNISTGIQPTVLG